MRATTLVSAWIPTIAGIGLLALAARHGSLALALAALPGILLISGGVRSLFVTDHRAPAHIVIGSLLGFLLAGPLGFVAGSTLALTMLTVSILGFFCGGWVQIRLQPSFDDVPEPGPSPVYSATVALDAAMIASMSAMAPAPSSAELRNAVEESITAQTVFAERGWIADPTSFHAQPPNIVSVEATSARLHGNDCELVRVESDFEPDRALPGRDRWLAYSDNRVSHACLLRRRGPGPWLVCVHGVGMGNYSQDFRTFRVAELHQRARVNVAMFTLPVHGLRSPGGFSGAKFMGLSVLDFVHAEAQSIWDLRRLIAWLRAQEATQVGVYGISLGAYTSAVLAGLENDLACVIAGVPPADLIHTREYLASPVEQRIAAAAGVDPLRDRTVHSVVSPLRLAPRLERERRFIFAATGDQFVPIEQARSLWLHWERPRISWCTGGHVSALLQRQPREFVQEAITSSFESSDA